MIDVYLIGGRFDGAVYRWPREPVPTLFVWLEEGTSKMSEELPVRHPPVRCDRYVHDHLDAVPMAGTPSELHHYRLQNA